MKKYAFKRTLLSALIVSAITANAYAEEEPEGQPPLTVINPHDQIGITGSIAEKYSGKGVRLGVLDSGFMVEHPLVDRSKLHPIIFELTDTSGRKHLFDPRLYDVETERDEEGNEKKEYSMHGGQVAGLIGAKSSDAYRYAGVWLKTAKFILLPLNLIKQRKDN